MRQDWNIEAMKKKGIKVGYISPKEYLKKTEGFQLTGESQRQFLKKGFYDIEKGEVRPIEELGEHIKSPEKKVIVPFIENGGGFGLITGDISATNIFTAALVIGLGRKGLARIDRRVMQQVSQMLVSQNPVVVQRGTTILQRRPRLMNAFRIGSSRIIGAAGATGGPISGQLQ